MPDNIKIKEDVVIKFAGDSGDGIQLTGTQFTSTAALAGNDLGTFPDFPAEIRAPIGTLAGVSGFQIHFGSREIHTPGDACDVLVVMNAAALKANLSNLKKGGIIIANEDGFDRKNLLLAGYGPEDEPLSDPGLSDILLYKAPVTSLTRECLKDFGLSTKEMDRSKNMFVLGMLYYMYSRDPQITIDWLNKKFVKKQDIAKANIAALNAGFAYADTTEIQQGRFEVKPAKLQKGTYRGIMGNQATAYGLIAASVKAGIPLFYGSYPITPASDILHELAAQKHFGVITFQAEDEIAAITSAIGAAFGGSLGVTASSGPGISLKIEAISMAVMMELPLVICNVQRAGPSTGMPTKMEQADLLQAVYGRAGEAPVPVVAAATPSDCFYMAFQAAKIALEHMTPVFFMSDGYLANGSEPWRFPKTSELSAINVQFAKIKDKNYDSYMPYLRDNKLVRPWAVPGTAGLEHRVGGIEKEDITGNVSYDPLNHEKMVNIRQQKIDNIADVIPLQELDSGPEKGKLLIVGWGSTYGTIKSALKKLNEEGINDVAHAHIRYINPFPSNLGKMLAAYDKIIVPENNKGQLVRLLRDKYLVDAESFNKIQGLPFSVSEIMDKVKELL